MSYINKGTVLCKIFFFDYFICLFELQFSGHIEDWKRMMPKGTEQDVEMMFSASMAAAFHLFINERGRYDKESVVNFIHNIINAGIRMFS